MGRSPTPSMRSEWQVGWYVTRCGKYAPTSVTPEHVDQELRQLVGPRPGPLDCLDQSRVARPAAGDDPVLVPRRPGTRPDGVTTASYPSKACTKDRNGGTASSR